MKCKGLHGLLLADEFNAHGAVVSCLICGKTFQCAESTLIEEYTHAHHTSSEGPEKDLDFFILDTAIA